jgi:putative colanic acid biosynthesis acetyltransferase WcaF
VNYYIFNSAFPWPYKLKHALLRFFGAKVGTGLVIKTKVRIKYPWRLEIGDHCWIGESVWIDNLDTVTLGNHVCLSQGAMLLTGNHDYKKSDFPYRLGGIIIEDGVWIGAQSVVCPGIVCKSHAVLTVKSVAAKDLDAWSVYAGNPAIPVRKREITE